MQTIEGPSETPVEAASFEQRYATQREMVFLLLKNQFDYGKWLLASLLTVHAGSLLAISQAGNDRTALYRACGPLLIYGVAATLIAGGLTWINFSAVSLIQASSLKDLTLGNPPSARGCAKCTANFSFWIVPAVATISLVFFVIAAVRATSVLHSN